MTRLDTPELISLNQNAIQSHSKTCQQEAQPHHMPRWPCDRMLLWRNKCLIPTQKGSGLPDSCASTFGSSTPRGRSCGVGLVTPSWPLITCCKLVSQSTISCSSTTCQHSSQAAAHGGAATCCACCCSTATAQGVFVNKVVRLPAWAPHVSHSCA